MGAVETKLSVVVAVSVDSSVGGTSNVMFGKSVGTGSTVGLISVGSSEPLKYRSLIHT